MWAPSHVVRARDVCRVPSSPGYRKCLPVWQMAVLRIKVNQKLYSECFLWISFSDSYSGLAGVDCSVVCPLVEPICLWGWCAKLSKVLSVMRVDFCKHEHSFHSYILNHFSTCDLAVRRLFKVLFQNDRFHVWMSRQNQWKKKISATKSFAGWFVQINLF